MRTTQIRKAIAELLETYTWLHVYPKVTDVFDLPAAIVFPPDIIDYGTVFGGGAKAMFPIRLYVGESQDPDVQDVLDDMVDDEGPKSIKVLLESDQRLGGLVQYTSVMMMRNYGPYPVASLLYLGAEIVLSVDT